MTSTNKLAILFAALFVLLVIVAVVVIYFIMSGKRAHYAGNVVVTITDEAADMTNVQDIRLTISKIQLQNAKGTTMTLSDEDRIYQLLTLDRQDVAKLYTSAAVAPGEYQALHIFISDVAVVEDSGNIKEALLLQKEIPINGLISVRRGATTAIQLDFLASESLHVTKKGTYIFAPVVELEARHGVTVNVNKETNTVKTTSGIVTENVTVGTSINGGVGKGFGIPKDQVLQITANGEVKILKDEATTTESDRVEHGSDAGLIFEVPEEKGTSDFDLDMTHKTHDSEIYTITLPEELKGTGTASTSVGTTTD